MRKKIDWDDVKRRIGASHLAALDSMRADPARIESAYRLRAERLAARQSNTAGSAATIQLLVFLLNAERYAIELPELSEILPLTDFTPIPGALAALFGVINLRGEIVPIVTLAEVLELPLNAGGTADGGASTGYGYVLMLNKAGFEAGLKVDQVEKIVAVSPAEIIGASEAISAQHLGETPTPRWWHSRYIKGISRENLLVLNVDAILTHTVFKAE